MSKLTCRDMDATVVFLDLEELWMGSTGDTILAFGCCYVHFCFNIVVTVIGYLMSLVNVIVIVAGPLMLDCLYTNTNTNRSGAARCMTGATQPHPACSSRCAFTSFF